MDANDSEITPEMTADQALWIWSSRLLREATELNDSNVDRADALRRHAVLADSYFVMVPAETKASDIAAGFMLLMTAEKHGYVVDQRSMEFYAAAAAALHGAVIHANLVGCRFVALWAHMATIAATAGTAGEASALANDTRILTGIVAGVPAMEGLQDGWEEEFNKRKEQRDLLAATMRSAFPDARLVGNRHALGYASRAAKPESLTTVVHNHEVYLVPCDVLEVDGDRHAVVSPDMTAVPEIDVLRRLRLHHPEAFATLRALVVEMGDEEPKYDLG